MNITVLGSYGPYPPAGGTCSGYLLEQEGCYILLECGNGILSKLQEFIDIKKLRAVIVSHLHSDHVSDLLILRYALKYQFETGNRDFPLQVICPSEPSSKFKEIFYHDVYSLKVINEAKKEKIGPFSFSFLTTVHSFPCYAIAIETHGVNKMVYSGDTEYFTDLSIFAKNTPLFLCESNFIEEDKQKGANNHLTAVEAASTARDAEAKRLLLTHLLPFRNPELYLHEAVPVFTNTELATEGKTYNVF